MIKRFLEYRKRRNLKKRYLKLKRSERAILTLIHETKEHGYKGSVVLARMLNDNKEKLARFIFEDYFNEKILGIHE